MTKNTEEIHTQKEKQEECSKKCAESMVSYIQKSNQNLRDLFSWKNPEQSLKAMIVLGIAGRAISWLGIWWTFNLVLAGPIFLKQYGSTLKQIKIGKYLSLIGTAAYNQITNFQCFQWKDMRQGILNLASVNLLLIFAPYLTSSNAVGLFLRILSMLMLLTFSLKGKSCSSSSSCSDVEQEKMQDNIKKVVKNAMEFYDFAVDIMTWKFPKQTGLVFGGLLLLSSLMVFFGTQLVVMVGFNGLSIAMHPTVRRKIM
jgi:hypothetical protein